MTLFIIVIILFISPLYLLVASKLFKKPQLYYYVVMDIRACELAGMSLFTNSLDASNKIKQLKLEHIKLDNYNKDDFWITTYSGYSDCLNRVQ